MDRLPVLGSRWQDVNPAFPQVALVYRPCPEQLTYTHCQALSTNKFDRDL